MEVWCSITNQQQDNKKIIKQVVESSMPRDYISVREFDAFKAETERHFSMLHDCDKRIEEQVKETKQLINNFLLKVEENREKKEELNFSLKSKVVLGVLTTGTGIISALTTYLIRIH